MGVIDLSIHLFNFMLPALAVGLSLPLVTRSGVIGRRATHSVWRQGLINAAAGLAVLLAGLLFWGQDGKLLTYLVMAGVCATSQWLLLGAWRRS